MDPIVVTAIVAAVSSVATVIVSEIVKARLNKPVARADAAQKEATAAHEVSDAALSLLEPLNKRIDALEGQQLVNMGEIAKLRATVARFRTWASDVMSGINTLIAQIREMGAEPRWTPKPFEE